ncbi:phosphoenolpyruvate--protein phosphotransferase [Thalassoroseus pseudoceratinae]|uniref:phosphoenolpyruvate--protein phosphotransferase n=1 Tax=Thalassoroseus pseudoceratinae TaxID=2713176 RepID=UPI00141DA2C2|nr:phosphoenolpyruvate--protein phosphotransferase [Thalassoroseus pseudoceratinae]
MLVKRGIAVSPGVVSGPAFVLGDDDARIARRFVRASAVDEEVDRFYAALETVCAEIAGNRELAAEQLGEQFGQIFSAHLDLARDPLLAAEIEDLIRQKSYSADYASSIALDRNAKRLRSLGNPYLAERATDVIDLKKRVLSRLNGEDRLALAKLTSPVIVLANNLTPSETAQLNREFVLGFATEAGGHTSHTAILAGALEIPAVVGLGRFLNDLSGGETVILDGNIGEVIIEPDEAAEEQYRDSQARFRSVAQRLESLSGLPAETQDGVRISLMGNIEFPEEADHCIERGADGVGLYRTEFLYLGQNQDPTEDDHFQAYSQVVSALNGRPVVIRTLDLGADKIPGSMEQLVHRGANPVLGLRSIRLSLQNLPLFKTQLRAILRAAIGHDVRIMFPLVSTLLEFRQAKMTIADVMEDLEEEGVPCARGLQIGMMVEVPAAVMMIEEFAREVDFFSIGTNDLIQYALAADRGDPSVANLYSSGDPSILRLIQRVVSAAQANDVPVSVCGQMSSDPRFVPLLVGMGLRQISVTPHVIPELKAVIRQLTIADAERIASQAMSFELARDVESFLNSELIKLCPDYLR